MYIFIKEFLLKGISENKNYSFSFIILKNIKKNNIDPILKLGFSFYIFQIIYN